MNNEDLYVQIGISIRSARKANKITQEQLGDLLSISRASLSNIERGRHRIQIHVLYEIAENMDMSITDFLAAQSQGQGAKKIIN
ncbi:helix-turn-helix domain-containing protein [Cohnella terricola]|uniref:Helix-turn-helix transcriptional regulator n=1 Tax=Cohnella terricola TaxID=1289167 RepID=A0A559JQM4_9BACL|nr:helix-turn-helix transcriptional regulator [Cohnella terricola]TVY02163.1 helix-turn-helix transcriptional regulator [Cohnella terricola]